MSSIPHASYATSMHALQREKGVQLVPVRVHLEHDGLGPPSVRARGRGRRYKRWQENTWKRIRPVLVAGSPTGTGG